LAPGSLGPLPARIVPAPLWPFLPAQPFLRMRRVRSPSGSRPRSAERVAGHCVGRRRSQVGTFGRQLRALTASVGQGRRRAGADGSIGWDWVHGRRQWCSNAGYGGVLGKRVAGGLPGGGGRVVVGWGV